MGEVRNWKSVVGNLEEADCFELRRLPRSHYRSTEIHRALPPPHRFCPRSIPPTRSLSFSASFPYERKGSRSTRVTIKVEINFLIRFTLAWLFGDAASAGIRPLRARIPRGNLKFLIKVIADCGFLSGSSRSPTLSTLHP